ncbi:hypothetical protein [Arthrobacter sp. D1-17]
MKKWSVLSIPAIGLAGLGIWAQSLAAAPTNQPTGVVVADPAASSSVSGSSAPAPASSSSASAPDRFRSSEAPRRLDMAQPQTTEQAETQDADDDGPGVVQHVIPTQVTSPAAPPPAGSASAKTDDTDGTDDSQSNDTGPDDSGPDDSAGLADSGGRDD